MKRKPIEILTREEVRKLLRACGSRRALPMRNRALIVLMWRCGLRISEVLDLQLRDIDFAAHTVRVRHGKGDKSRTVGIDSDTIELIHAWMRMRDLMRVADDSPLICTYDGKRVPRTFPGQMLNRLKSKCGITKRLHPHALRHLFAVELVRDGVHVTQISQLLGHEDLSTTTRYLAALEPRDAIDSIVKRPAWMSIDK